MDKILNSVVNMDLSDEYQTYLEEGVYPVSKVAQKKSTNKEDLVLSAGRGRSVVQIKISDSHKMVDNNKEMYKIFGHSVKKESFKTFYLTKKQLSDLHVRIQLTGNRFEMKWKKVTRVNKNG